MRTRKWAAVLALVAVALFALSACGDDDDSSNGDARTRMRNSGQEMMDDGQQMMNDGRQMMDDGEDPAGNG